MTTTLADMLSSPCSTCLLRVPAWQGKTEPDGFCIWFLKKLKVPRPIPATVAPIGCKNWQPKTKEK